MLVTHLDKTRGEDGRASLDAQIRGSNALAGAYDVHIALRRYSHKIPTITITILSRDAALQTGTVDWDYEGGKASIHVEEVM